jgi:hypothetical protein
MAMKTEDHHDLPNTSFPKLEDELSKTLRINHDIIYKVEDEGVVLNISFKRDFSHHEPLKLEGICRQIFLHIEGEMTYGSLIEIFMKEHLLEFFEAKGLFDHYLDRLDKSELIK